MKDVKQVQQQHQQKQQVAQLDPTTLASWAKESFYQLPESARQDLGAPIEEVITRFEQQTRASQGSIQTQSQQFAGSSS